MAAIWAVAELAGGRPTRLSLELATLARQLAQASGGTATLDEAIKKKYAKKEMLIKKNMDTITKSYEMAKAWAEDRKLAIAAF